MHWTRLADFFRSLLIDRLTTREMKVKKLDTRYILPSILPRPKRTIQCPYFILAKSSTPQPCAQDLFLVLNLNFDSSLRRVCGDVESVDCVFEGESVGDEWFEVYQTPSNESKGFRVLCVSLLLRIVSKVDGRVEHVGCYERGVMLRC